MKKNLSGAISPYADYCAGYQNPGASGGNYIMTLALGIGVAKKQLSHSGSKILDQTHVFDLAEVEDTYLGQTNMITVSSFCGPHGSIWGYHLAKQQLVPHKLIPSGTYTHNNVTAKIYSAKPLLEATSHLLGTVTEKKFPILPGSHVPCANKSLTAEGPAIIYGSIGIGIPVNGEENACLMMEDIGNIPLNLSKPDMELYQANILTNLIKSIMMVAENQQVKYKEIFIEIKTAHIKQSEIGCVLVAAPYLTLAQNAIPASGINSLAEMTLREWENSIQ